MIFLYFWKRLKLPFFDGSRPRVYYGTITDEFLHYSVQISVCQLHWQISIAPVTSTSSLTIGVTASSSLAWFTLVVVVISSVYSLVLNFPSSSSLCSTCSCEHLERVENQSAVVRCHAFIGLQVAENETTPNKYCSLFCSAGEREPR